MKVTVTGATGFIAQHCIQELKSHGYEIRGTVRNKTAAAKQPVLSDIELVETDLLKDEGWADAFTGVDAVLHTASPVKLEGSEEELIGPALEGTLRVLKAASDAGVKRIVLTSSTAAIVNTDAEVYNEECWSDPDKCNPYPKSKTLAERAAWDFIDSLPEDNRPELVVCNPCVVLGPALSANVSSSLVIVQKLLERKLPALPHVGFSIADVRDVAIAHRLALETPAAAGNRYLLSSEFYWMRDISQVLKDAFSNQGFRPTTLPMPYFILWLAALFDPMAKSVLDDVGVRSRHDTSKARNELGWQPRPVRGAIVDTARSLIDFGLVKPAKTG